MADKRLLVSDQTGEKIKQLAKKRGVTMGAYLDWLIRYIEENPIDQEAALENKYFPMLKKQVDRVIAIIRRIETDSIIPTNMGVKAVVQQLAELLPGKDGEITEELGSDVLLELEEFKTVAAKVPGLQSQVEILKERIRFVLNKVKPGWRGNGGTVELSQLDLNTLQEALER